MKFLRPALSILALLTFHFAQAQYNETETNDDFPNANDVVVNAQATIDGVLGSGGDHLDYFRLTVTEYCTISVDFSSTPNYSMSIGLYNSEYYGLAVMPSYSQTGSGSVSFECAVAGTYYVRIGDYIANTTPLPYTITINLQSPLASIDIDPEYNDEKDSAQWVNLQQTIYPNIKQETVRGNLRYRHNPGNPDINDWYKFITTSPGAVQIVLPSAGESYSLYLSSDHGSVAQDLFSNQEAYCLEPDTYYLRMNTGTFGACFDYQFIVRHTATFNGTQENEPNNDIANAQPFNQDMYARIGYNSYDESGTPNNDDRDFFQLITHEDGDLVIDIEPDSTAYGYSVSLISDQSNNFLQATTTGNPAQGDTVQMRLSCAQADTFYLKIQTTGWCGNYHVRYDVERDSVGVGATEIEPNNSLEEAQDISNDHVVISDIDHRDNSNAPVYVYDEIDYYRFTPTTEGDLRIVVSGAPGGFIFPDIYLLDSLGNELGFESNDTLIYECSSRIPYFVSVDMTSCKQYRLEWQVVSDFGTDEEPNDLLSQANEFPLGGSVSFIEGRLGALQPSNFNDTYDYYKVMMGLAGNTKLWFTSEDGFGTLDIWSAAGDLRSSHLASMTDSVEIDLGCLAMDTFYISVSSTSCFGYRVSGMIDFILGNPDPEPNDQPNMATDLIGFSPMWGRLGGEVISQASLGDTKDYYRLLIEDHGSLTIGVDALNSVNTSLIAQILATDGVTVLESDTLWNEGETQLMFECMQPDTLYLLVKPLLVGIECQTYTLEVSQTSPFGIYADQEPNDNEQEAISLTSGQTTEGIVGFFRYGTADIDAGDYYKLNATPGVIGIDFNSYESLDSVRVTVSSPSASTLLQFDGNDLFLGGSYFNSFNFGYTEPIYVEVQDIQQCGHYDLTLTQDPTVGLNDFASSQIEVYPNPANSIITVKGVPISQLQLLDVQGRLVQETSSAQMQLHDVASGVYYLKIAITDSESVHYRRVVKE